MILAQSGNAGTTNTGGGGGGSGNAQASAPAGAGGSGIVIIRYAVNLTSTSTLAIPNGGFVYRVPTAITVTTSTSGFVDFKANGKYIPGCRGVLASAGNSYVATCNYKSATHGSVIITTLFRPTDAGYSQSTATSGPNPIATRVIKR
jgi:hypothetical protein